MRAVRILRQHRGILCLTAVALVFIYGYRAPGASRPGGGDVLLQAASKGTSVAASKRQLRAVYAFKDRVLSPEQIVSLAEEQLSMRGVDVPEDSEISVSTLLHSNPIACRVSFTETRVTPNLRHHVGFDRSGAVKEVRMAELGGDYMGEDPEIIMKRGRKTAPRLQ